MEQTSYAMNSYSFAFTIYRIAAVGILLYVLYSSVAYRVFIVPEFASAANAPQGNMIQTTILQTQVQGAENLHQALVRASLLELGSAAFLYVFAPLLARLTTLGH